MFQVNPLLLSSKDKSKKLKCRLLQFLFGALRVSDKHSDVFKASYIYRQSMH